MEDKFRTWVVTWRAFDAVTGGLVNHGQEFRHATSGIKAVDLVKQDTAIIHYYGDEAQYRLTFHVAGGLGTLTIPEVSRALLACTPDDLDELMNLIKDMRGR